jgi:hypothetical protein
MKNLQIYRWKWPAAPSSPATSRIPAIKLRLPFLQRLRASPPALRTASGGVGSSFPAQCGSFPALAGRPIPAQNYAEQSAHDLQQPWEVWYSGIKCAMLKVV